MILFLWLAEELQERLRAFKERKKLAAQSSGKVEQASKKTPAKDATSLKLGTARNVPGKILTNKQVSVQGWSMIKAHLACMTDRV